MSLLDAINAAAAMLQSEQKSEPKGAPKSAPKAAQPKASAKAAPKSETPKTKAASKREQSGAGSNSAEREQARPKVKGGASYVIPAEFKQAIEDYLNGRPDMADKLKAKGKSIDGCCDYIFDVMRKRAEKQRGGKSAVGLYASPDEIFGMAVHYYDESDESLKAELKVEELKK